MAAGGAALMPAIETTQAVGDAVCQLARADGKLNGRYQVLNGWKSGWSECNPCRVEDGMSRLYPLQILDLAYRRLKTFTL